MKAGKEGGGGRRGYNLDGCRLYAKKGGISTFLGAPKIL
jgi:hypothetical protein